MTDMDNMTFSPEEARRQRRINKMSEIIDENNRVKALNETLVKKNVILKREYEVQEAKSVKLANEKMRNVGLMEGVRQHIETIIKKMKDPAYSLRADEKKLLNQAGKLVEDQGVYHRDPRTNKQLAKIGKRMLTSGDLVVNSDEEEDYGDDESGDEGLGLGLGLVTPVLTEETTLSRGSRGSRGDSGAARSLLESLESDANTHEDMFNRIQSPSNNLPEWVEQLKDMSKDKLEKKEKRRQKKRQDRQRRQTGEKSGISPLRL